MSFYKDDNNLDVIEFGKGDVLVSKIVIDKDIHGIGFGEIEPGDINRKVPEKDGLKDIDAGIKLKMFFTNKDSIDVVINKLKNIRKSI